MTGISDGLTLPSPASIRLDATRVVLLAADRPRTREFAAELGPQRLVGAVWERRARRRTLAVWRRRFARHGVVTTASRLLALTADHLLYRVAERREPSTPPRSAPSSATGIRTRDVNAPDVVDAVRRWRPTLAIVVGTTLIRPPLLDALSGAIVVNVHVGMTPRYRGTHGGAWAIIEGHPEQVATTIHVLDAGIDTGRPLVYLPVRPRSTMTALARAQVRAGTAWLADLVASGGAAITPVSDVPDPRPLRYPPPLRQWRLFRARTRGCDRAPRELSGSLENPPLARAGQ